MNIDTGTEELLCDLSDRVLTVTLNRPQARNDLSMELMFALRRILAEYGDHEDVGALVVTGAGSAFCAGGDVKRMAARKADDQPAEEKFQVMVARHRETAGVIRQLRIPTVAALPGPAAGAGPLRLAKGRPGRGPTRLAPCRRHGAADMGYAHCRRPPC